jgi:hypothetical protein
MSCESRKIVLIIPKYRFPHGGAQISEFAVSLFFLFAFVVIPLINLCVVPIRWGLGKSVVSARVHQLAQSEMLSQALKSEQGASQQRLQNGSQPGLQQPVQASPQEELQDKLNKIGGITVKSSQLSLTIESAKRQGETKSFSKVGSIDKDWLPDGPLGPYVYRLDLQVDGDVAPLFVLPLQNMKVPGLTIPFAVQFHDTSVWENTGRDPVSGEFFVNE